MSFNWIDVEGFSFNALLLMERFQLRYMFESRRENANWRRNMGLALAGNPAVAWYVARRCPECAAIVEEIAASAPSGAGAAEIRAAEVAVLASVEDFTLYTKPEIMDASCDFIYGWNRERLFELADFADKTVLDVGSGSGRLAFAAAERAKEVYASEPVGTLREYLRDKIKREGIRNVRVSDGMADSLPYPGDTFDIVMSGHVVGDDYEGEIAELARVVKPGGWLIDCPGDQPRRCAPNEGLLARGWEEFRYVGSFGMEVYRYRRQVFK
ncbi:MAG: putative methyltransferase YcgJ [Firmicutes bacterium ADurb.Bin248]|nr:MAG: putative methyltransferase YcgJ [Firmicutes bacterium ADurb.Bin248]HOG01252.1 class I SAM-dependent methyltransferase [Clostridia bacterium]HPK15749.1 class I SAM-dependent methyltransferase [Clostridia bacterium]